jgi:hypothetical protein
MDSGRPARLRRGPGLPPAGSDPCPAATRARARAHPLLPLPGAVKPLWGLAGRVPPRAVLPSPAGGGPLLARPDPSSPGVWHSVSWGAPPRPGRAGWRVDVCGPFSGQDDGEKGKGGEEQAEGVRDGHRTGGGQGARGLAALMPARSRFPAAASHPDPPCRGSPVGPPSAVGGALRSSSTHCRKGDARTLAGSPGDKGEVVSVLLGAGVSEGGALSCEAGRAWPRAAAASP